MERIGLLGLPNAGKSSLFNALTGGDVPVAAHPYTTTETTVGVARVPDPRLDALAEMSASRKVVHAGVDVVDIAGLASGAAGGEGLGNRFLAGIREVDALCYVLRAFEDAEVPGDVDPVGALEALEMELVLADIATIEGQIDRRRKAMKAAKGDKQMAELVEAMEAAYEELGAGTPLYRSGLAPAVRGRLAEAFLLTSKPVLAVVNIGEDQLGTADGLVADVARSLGVAGPIAGEPGHQPGGEPGAGAVLAVAVQLEAEASRLAESDRSELLEGLGLGEGVLPRLAQVAYQVLGRRTFFTTGDKESRAWTFRAGSTARTCAGVIHSDLERGFIRAEVIHWDELLKLGSWNEAKAAGKLRLEGKEYVVEDGDVLEIRFNV